MVTGSDGVSPRSPLPSQVETRARRISQGKAALRNVPDDVTQAARKGRCPENKAKQAGQLWMYADASLSPPGRSGRPLKPRPASGRDGPARVSHLSPAHEAVNVCLLTESAG